MDKYQKYVERIYKHLIFLNRNRGVPINYSKISEIMKIMDSLEGKIDEESHLCSHMKSWNGSQSQHQVPEKELIIDHEYNEETHDLTIITLDAPRDAIEQMIISYDDVNIYTGPYKDYFLSLRVVQG